MALSAEDRRVRALREIEARRPTGGNAVVTLQLDHPALPEPVRVVADDRDLNARTEDDALATFTALAFRAAPPPQIEGLELDRTEAGDLVVTGIAGFYGLDRQFGKLFDPNDCPGIIWDGPRRRRRARGPRLPAGERSARAGCGAAGCRSRPPRRATTC